MFFGCVCLSESISVFILRLKRISVSDTGAILIHDLFLFFPEFGMCMSEGINRTTRKSH